MSTYVIYGADVETVIAVWVVGAVIVAVVCARGSCRRPGTCFCRCCWAPLIALIVVLLAAPGESRTVLAVQGDGRQRRLDVSALRSW